MIKQAVDAMEVTLIKLFCILKLMVQQLNQVILMLLKIKLVKQQQDQPKSQVFKILQKQAYKQQLNNIQFQSVLMPQIGVVINQESSVIATKISIMQLWL